ncbi:OLC1v1023795C1 [Oldenlandia corymbosa var. corymbosa]|uniref:OLC1v1023795C1 n=1 Tax=Oldenlandia corymbosa var. corymbosa TaxID=529605 RepID=A0AAV1C1A6_OLDCO|nr:OLC1v1023795C1 [Oldenlandia corymbosa var. corymbosa]
MDLAMVTPISTHQQTLYSLKTRGLSYKLSPTKCEELLSWGGRCHQGEKSTNSKERYILKNVSCEVKPGELTAIAGPSGAGKTTLLEILAGVTVPSSGITGDVLVNDRPLNVVHFRRISGYVTQDEALFPHLTVEETLVYSARLRLRCGPEAARERVTELLKELGLDHVAGTRIGSESSRGISGGEKRRVSIGVDLVHDPAVVLIDEPTSGLDSKSALNLMLLLKSMAKKQGKTILISIHQPGYRILELFDKVILLSDGILLHDGPLCCLEERLKSSGHCIPHHFNVLEFAIDVSESLEMDETDIESCDDDQLDENSTNDDLVGKVSVFAHVEEELERFSYSNSPLKEVWILSQRFSKNIFRTNQLFAARTMQALLAGILLGTIFLHAYSNANKTSSLQSQIGFFAFTLTFLLSSTTEALPIFLQEKRILTRETSRGAYRLSSYIIANTLVFIPFLLLIALLYTTPVYWLVGLRRDIDGFLYFCLVAWMVVLMSNSFVACFSAMVPNFVSGMSLIAGVIGAFFLFSGYFISKEEMPKYWRFMYYLSLFKYPFESLLINEFGGKNGATKCVEGAGGFCLLYGHEFLRKLGIDESKKWNNLVVMLFFVVVYRILGFVILWFKSYRTRS